MGVKQFLAIKTCIHWKWNYIIGQSFKNKPEVLQHFSIKVVFFNKKDNVLLISSDFLLFLMIIPKAFQSVQKITEGGFFFK